MPCDIFFKSNDESRDTGNAEDVTLHAKWQTFDNVSFNILYRFLSYRNLNKGASLVLSGQSFEVIVNHLWWSNMHLIMLSQITRILQKTSILSLMGQKKVDLISARCAALFGIDHLFSFSFLFLFLALSN